jgi:hypothetical protein
MKHKLFVILLISLLMVSVIVVAFADVCPRCHGTGTVTEKIPCPTCNGAGASSPDIAKKSISSGDASIGGKKAVNVQRVFHNNGDTEITATVTATVKTQTQTFTNSTTATFPPNADTTVTIRIEGVDRQPYYAYFMDIAGYGSTNCPTCQGTGYINETITCPTCKGTGVVSSSVAGGTGAGYTGPSIGADYTGPIVGVVVVGAVVATGFFVMKKRRVTEQSLRRLSSYEFQNWVVKRLAANPSAQRDSYLGIDAYTVEGYPIQIRQEDDVGKRAIDSFAAAIARSKARNGTMVAFGFGKDSYEGVMKARLNYRLEIRTLTVNELLTSKGRTL